LKARFFLKDAGRVLPGQLKLYEPHTPFLLRSRSFLRNELPDKLIRSVLMQNFQGNFDPPLESVARRRTGKKYTGIVFSLFLAELSTFPHKNIISVRFLLRTH